MSLTMYKTFSMWINAFVPVFVFHPIYWVVHTLNKLLLSFMVLFYKVYNTLCIFRIWDFKSNVTILLYGCLHVGIYPVFMCPNVSVISLSHVFARKVLLLCLSPSTYQEERLLSHLLPCHHFVFACPGPSQAEHEVDFLFVFFKGRTVIKHKFCFFTHQYIVFQIPHNEVKWGTFWLCVLRLENILDNQSNQFRSCCL